MDLMRSSHVVSSRRLTGAIASLPTVALLVAAAPAFASDAVAPTAQGEAPSGPATSPGSESTVSGGLAATVVGEVGSFEGGVGFKVQAGWSPLPALRIIAAAEKAFPIGEILCDCAEWPCCQGANAPYTWLGMGLEGHATPRRLIDVYASGEVGTVVRNAWRFAAKGQVGFDVRVRIVAIGLFGGVLVASSDSLFNEHKNYTFTAGLRALVVLPIRR
jgi:hypothetical protein